MLNDNTIISYTPTNLDDIEKCEQNIQSLLDGSNSQNLVVVNFSSRMFPNRLDDLPEQLKTLSLRNPRVKIAWDNNIPDGVKKVEVFGVDKVSKDVQMQTERKYNYLDMTLISVFYDMGINPLRKVATKKAVQCWLKQRSLPNEILFVELGFNGTFTFSKEDFPKQVKYIKIDGNDSNKYLFQKEHLWNIAAKQAKNEKLMFIDSDIAPVDDVDWFKQIYDALDKCLFTQGFRQIQYLDAEDKPKGKDRNTYTHQIVTGGKVNLSVPGGVYCMCKSTLQVIGYFNYLPFGGGDNMFWAEITNTIRSSYPWFILNKREHVSEAVQVLKKMTGKELLGTVYVDISHFYHGELKGRSYRQRHYMMMTQFPLNEDIMKIMVIMFYVD